MESRRKAGRAPARVDEPSRRSMMVGSAVTCGVAAMSAPEAAAAPSVAICHRWLAIDAEQRRLQLEWGTLEGWLITNRNWYKLTPEQ